MFTQFNLEVAKKIWYEVAFEDGEERGLAAGRSQGKSLNMVELVQRKLRKGKTAETIGKNWKNQWRTWSGYVRR